VTDSGEGMDQATLSHIFEPFFTTKEPGRGTGLGLSSVYGIVQQSGGQIAVESAKDAGTTFRLIFPASEGTPDAVAAAAPAISATLTHARILLVEDEPQVREITEQTLAALGYDVVSWGDPLDAIDEVEQASSPFDLLITDIMLPGMNGTQLAQALRARDPKLRVLFMSGFPGDGLAPESLKKAPFLKKPVLPAELTAKVEEILSTPANPLT
jgi:CheY-like chemotaxis protein